MPAIKPLLYVSIATESTYGTAVTPVVTKLMGVKDITMKPHVKIGRYQEMRGTLQPAYLAGLEELGGEVSLDMYATYEDTPYLLDALFGLASTNSAPAPYIRAYAAPLAATPTNPRIYSLAYSDGTNSYRATSAVLKKLNIKAEIGKPTMLKADFIAASILPIATPANPADRTVTLIMGQHTFVSGSNYGIYLDAFSGTMGTSQINTSAYAFEIDIDTKRDVERFMGSVTPQTYHDSEFDGTLKLDLEVNTTSKAFLDALLNTTDYYGLLFQTTFTIGATTTLRSLQLQFAGTFEKAPDLFSFRQDATSLKCEIKGLYQAAFGNFFKATSNNGVSAAAML